MQVAAWYPREAAGAPARQAVWPAVAARSGAAAELAGGRVSRRAAAGGVRIQQNHGAAVWPFRRAAPSLSGTYGGKRAEAVDACAARRAARAAFPESHGGVGPPVPNTPRPRIGIRFVRRRQAAARRVRRAVGRGKRRFGHPSRGGAGRVGARPRRRPPVARNGPEGRRVIPVEGIVRVRERAGARAEYGTVRVAELLRGVRVGVRRVRGFGADGMRRERVGAVRPRRRAAARGLPAKVYLRRSRPGVERGTLRGASGGGVRGARRGARRRDAGRGVREAAPDAGGFGPGAAV